MNYKIAVVLALLSGVPTLLAGFDGPKPLPSPPLTADNSTLVPPFAFRDNGKTILTIQDGDYPVGPCNLGALVRAAKAHMETEHRPLPSNVLCLNKTNQSWGTCPGDPAPVPLSEDFQSWEVCGDEGDGGWGTFQYPIPNLSKDPKMLREMADCIERRTEKRGRAAKWQAEQEAKRAKIEADFRKELSRCEPDEKTKVAK